MLEIRLSKCDLKSGDPELDAAMKPFPDDGPILHVAVGVAVKGGKPPAKDLLARAAAAEFKHFSSFLAPATIVYRPRADYLRQYFALLSKAAAVAAPKPGEL